LDLKRRDGPFVAVNCSAISPGLAESELFGHRRGAFTGADRDRKGLIRSAEGGVLFLDEIGELDNTLQAKLMRVLQENRVLGVGEDREVAVSVRIIAATNRDLDAMVQQGKFRADLFHRLHVLSIHITPLRERPADLGREVSVPAWTGPPRAAACVPTERPLRPPQMGAYATPRWALDTTGQAGREARKRDATHWSGQATVLRRPPGGGGWSTALVLRARPRPQTASPRSAACAKGHTTGTGAALITWVRRARGAQGCFPPRPAR
jgi:hypothetical protein